MAKTDSANPSASIWEIVSVLFQALLIAGIIRTFLFQPFSIPSGSMRPTLLEGDYLFVSKYAYGYSHHSFPFSPNFFSGRVWEATPERGDVLVFKYPRDTSKDYIKRIVGLPGDKIQMKAALLFINGIPVKREPAGEIDNVDITEEIGPVDVFKETLPNGVTFDTLDSRGNDTGEDTREFLVPEGHYFMIGDNRNHSSDSRFDVGFVPADHLVGRANVIFFSIAGGYSPLELWQWPSQLRLNRFFSWVD